MFQFPSLAYFTYIFCKVFPDITPERLSDSEIPGLKIVAILPGLIAGSHVLHRLLVPRHPPYALCNFFQNPHIDTGSVFRTLGRKCINIYLLFLWNQNVKEQNYYLWSYGESNPEPLACKASALPVEL